MSSNLNKDFNPMDRPKATVGQPLTPYGNEVSFDSLPSEYKYRAVNIENIHRRMYTGWERVDKLPKDILMFIDPNQIVMKILPTNNDLNKRKIRTLTKMRTDKIRNGITRRNINVSKEEVYIE